MQTMASTTSRLLLFRTPFFRIYRNPAPFSPLSTTLPLKNRPLSLHPFRSLLFKTLPKPLQFHSDTSSAVADVDGPANDSAPSVSHPWPEWGTFIERLKSKGYFEEPEASSPSEGVEGPAPEAPMDLNQIKTACLTFARERFDIFRWGFGSFSFSSFYCLGGFCFCSLASSSVCLMIKLMNLKQVPMYYKVMEY